ncbi:MAG TPA: GNAT family N-acetyltransferase [Flavobacteriales bacterium]|nr:GNAT family N-acetyltransferase [Flavobacteriales bacterium]
MLTLRMADKNDCDLYYKWANDELVRANSFHSGNISYEKHVLWFNDKINDRNTFFYLFTEHGNMPAGQVRIEKKEKETVIGISIDEAFRGKSLAAKMLVMASNDFLSKFPQEKILAYIKTSNQASYRAFLKAGFMLRETAVVSGAESYILIKTL